MADVNLLQQIEELRRRLDAVENLSVSPPLRLIDAFGAKSLEIDDPSHWARITAVSSGLYSHAEVVPNPSAPATWSLLAAGITGTSTDGPAYEVNGSTTVPVDGSFVAWLRPHPNGKGWIFEESGGTSSTGFYAKITGGTGPYSWTECTVSGGTVSSARTGTLNATEATTGLTGIPNGGTVVVWMTGSGSSYSFNAKMFTLVTSWTFSGTGSSCTITPATTKTVVISGPNLCGSTT